jgi:hypothetical protein
LEQLCLTYCIRHIRINMFTEDDMTFKLYIRQTLI